MGYVVARITGGGAVNRSVARLNIEHFRRLLEQDTDEAKRRIILQLLAEQEALLFQCSGPPKRGFTPERLRPTLASAKAKDPFAVWSPS